MPLLQQALLKSKGDRTCEAIAMAGHVGTAYVSDLIRGARAPSHVKGYRTVARVFGLSLERVAMFALLDAGLDPDELRRALDEGE